jgi:hypothetical protein
MTRRAAKVVLLHRNASSMVSDWIDHIELRRDAYATFSVWGNKYGEDPMTGRRRWFEWNKTQGLKSPLAIYTAIEDEAEYLNVEMEWVDAIPLIASIDWLTAAVIARGVGLKIPVLPDIEVLLIQRSLRSIGRVSIGAEWGNEMHELTLPFERWVRILSGESWSIGMPYWCEGQQFTGKWSFDETGGLVVSYDDDGGVGWEGDLGSLDVLEGPKLDNVDLARLALAAVERDGDGSGQPGSGSKSD